MGKEGKSGEEEWGGEKEGMRVEKEGKSGVEAGEGRRKVGGE